MSINWQEIAEKLSAPFNPEDVHWRVGNTNAKKAAQGEPLKGQPLAYIDARDVMERLDFAVGPDGWQDDYKEVRGRIVCTITIHGVSKSDGAGDTDMEGEKGGLSDAFKRAAVKWGVGRYLYDVRAGWVELDAYKGIPKSALPALRACLPKVNSNSGALPLAIKNIREGLKANDSGKVTEEWRSLNESQQSSAWREFSSHEKSSIKEALGVVK